MSVIKDQESILNKLGIEALNEMQKEAQQAIRAESEVVLLSPTGTGKTLAFLLPILEELDAENQEVQVLIVAPSRELVIQIEQVARSMGSGFKINAVYGGRQFSKDKIELKHTPAILIGTPGRVAEHFRRNTFSTSGIHFLVLDEFDKSLEVGFETEMKEIISALPNVKKKILTSATESLDVPRFVGLKNPKTLKFSGEKVNKLKVKVVVSPSKDKLDTLVETLKHIGNKPGIVFCNFKESIDRVSEHLSIHNINHGTFYGGMEQKDRERALIKFRNGTYKLLVATDLAARGIDVPEIKFIIHYHLPQRSEEFIHRNGRTARMNREGTAYVIKWEKEALPDYIHEAEEVKMTTSSGQGPSMWKTVFVSGGRKDKISKGDIAGLFIKQGGLSMEEVGSIELKHDCAFVAIDASKIDRIKKVDNVKLKNKKIRVSVV
ncbi:MAG: DEAD/DEAH box helicase [Candidatus Cyclobacteriaceae bacterium M2_1C_046]